MSSGDYRKSRKFSFNKEFCTMIMVAVIFIAGGIFFFFMSFYVPLNNVYKSVSWEPVPAAVTASQLAERDAGMNKKASYTIKIEYRYEYNGKNYTGDLYDFFRSRNRYFSFGEMQMQDIVDSHPAGKKITCLVNPENPAESVISRKLYYPALAFGIIPIVAFGIGISTVIYLTIDFKRSKKK